MTMRSLLSGAYYTLLNSTQLNSTQRNSACCILLNATQVISADCILLNRVVNERGLSDVVAL